MKLGKNGSTLDEIDLRILEILQTDATTPRTRVADLVGLSAPSVLDRIRKLEESGTIRGYHALIDARSVGLDVTSFIGVSLQHPRQIESFEAEVTGLKAVQECHHVTGDFTLLLKAKTASTASLEELISRLRSIEGVSRTITMVVLSTQTERVELDLDPQEPDAIPKARRTVMRPRRQ
jgi:Lrp/AsnC family leucine-responsive transcriptional regulator